MQIRVVACAGSSSSAGKWLCNFAKRGGVGGLVARFKLRLTDSRFSRGRRRDRGMQLPWPMRTREMVRWSSKPARNGRLGGSEQKPG